MTAWLLALIAALFCVPHIAHGQENCTQATASLPAYHDAGSIVLSNEIGSSGDSEINGTLTFNCSAGYVLYGATYNTTQTITCQMSGLWTSATNCVIVCASAPASANTNTTLTVVNPAMASPSGYYVDTQYTLSCMNQHFLQLDYISSDQTLFCNTTGDWVSNVTGGNSAVDCVKTCTVPTSGNIDVAMTVADGATLNGKVMQGVTVNVTCQSNYSFSGAPMSTMETMTCNDYEAYSNNPVCLSTCAFTLSDLSRTNVTWSANSLTASGRYLQGSTATFSCLGGRLTAPNENMTRQCSGMDMWDNGTQPVCYDVCTLPTGNNIDVALTTANGTIESNKVRVTVGVTVMCQSNYSFSGSPMSNSEMMACTSHETYSSNPVCLPTCAFTLSDPARTNVTWSADSSTASSRYLQGSVATFSCLGGRLTAPNENMTRQCNGMDMWDNGTQPVCYDVCTLPTGNNIDVALTTANGTIESNKVRVTVGVTVMCQSNYSFSGSPMSNSEMMACTSHETYSSNPVCLPTCAFTLSDPSRTNVTWSADSLTASGRYIQGSVATFSCLGGRLTAPNENMTRQCNGMDMWDNGTQPVCYDVCTLPTGNNIDVALTTANGTIESNKVRVTVGVTVMCQSNYSFSGTPMSNSEMMACTSHETYSSSPVCLPTCAFTLSDSSRTSVSWSANSLTTSGRYLQGSVATFSCLGGRLTAPNENMTRQCNGMDMWDNDTQPVCYDVCTLPTGNNIDVALTTANGTIESNKVRLTVGLSVTCQSNYSFSDAPMSNSEMVACTSHETYSKNLVCLPTCAFNLNDPARTNVTWSADSLTASGRYLQGSVATFSCLDGRLTAPNENMTRQCNGMDLWDNGTQPVCYDVCTLPSGNNIDVASTTADGTIESNKVRSTVTVNVTCQSNYSFLSAPMSSWEMMTCSSHETYSNTPVCSETCAFTLADSLRTNVVWSGNSLTASGRYLKGSVGTFSCLGGRVTASNENMTRQCNGMDVWDNETQPVCFDVCATSALVLDANTDAATVMYMQELVPGYVLVGGSASYTCQTGNYMVNDTWLFGQNQTCQSGMTWSGGMNCEKVCDVFDINPWLLSSTTDGSTWRTTAAHGTVYHAGTTVTMNCTTGYFLPTDGVTVTQTVSCQDNHTWSDHLYCTKVCPSTLDLGEHNDNTTITFTNQTSGGPILPGGYAEYSCNAQTYLLNDHENSTISRYCLDDGTWQPGHDCTPVCTLPSDSYTVVSELSQASSNHSLPVGASMRVDCITNYSFANAPEAMNQTIQCVSSETWNISNVNCVPTCVVTITDPVRTSMTLPVGSWNADSTRVVQSTIATFSCVAPRVPDTETPPLQRTCTGIDAWDNAMQPVCIDVCPAPSYDANVDISSVVKQNEHASSGRVRVGGNVTYACTTGYVLEMDPESTTWLTECQVNLTWTKFSRCVKLCQLPNFVNIDNSTYVANAPIVNGRVAVGSNVTMSCLTDHAFTDKPEIEAQTVKCTATNTWDRTLACSKTCPAVSGLDITAVSLSTSTTMAHNGRYLAGTIATLQCIAPRTISNGTDGTTTRACQNDTWSNAIVPLCQKSCAAVPNPTPSTRVLTYNTTARDDGRYTVNTGVDLSCATDMVFTDSNPMTHFQCFDQDMWTNNISSLAACSQTCALPTFPNLNTSLTMTSPLVPSSGEVFAGGWAAVTCLSGHVFTTHSQFYTWNVTCNETAGGVWSEELVCERTCYPHNVTTLTLSYSTPVASVGGYVVTTIATYQCPANTSFDNNVDIDRECTSQQMWDSYAEPPTCRETCRSLDSAGNAVVYNDTARNDGRFFVGASANISCRDTYVPLVNASVTEVTCLANDMWSASDPLDCYHTCTPQTGGNIDSAKTETSLMASNGLVPVGSKAVHECTSKYVHETMPTMVNHTVNCTANETWSEAIICVPTCAEVTDPLNQTSINITHLSALTHNGRYTQNAIVTFDCLPGYIMNPDGARVWQCIGLDTWNATSVPECYKSCAPYPLSIGQSIVYDQEPRADSGAYLIWATGNISCTDGYMLTTPNANNTVQCVEVDTWTGSDLGCVAVCPADGPWMPQIDGKTSYQDCSLGRLSRKCSNGTWEAVDATNCYAFVNKPCPLGETCLDGATCQLSGGVHVCLCDDGYQPVDDSITGRQICRTIERRANELCENGELCVGGSLCKKGFNDTSVHPEGVIVDKCVCPAGTIEYRDLITEQAMCGLESSCGAEESVSILDDGTKRCMNVPQVSGSYTTALTTCNRTGNPIVTVKSVQEWNYFHELRINGREANGPALDHIWIGLRYVPEIQQYQYADGSMYTEGSWLPDDFQPTFEENYPMPLNPIDQRYCIASTMGNNYKWKFEGCDENAREAVCYGPARYCTATGEWPLTLENEYHQIMCGQGLGYSKFRFCQQGGLWADPKHYCFAWVDDSCLYGEICQLDSVCVGNADGKTCQCPPGKTEYNETGTGRTGCKVTEAYVGETCVNGETCMGRSSCDTSMMCTCPCTLTPGVDPNQPGSDKQICLPDMAYVGDYCLNGQECQGGSECINGVRCGCPTDTLPEVDTNGKMVCAARQPCEQDGIWPATHANQTRYVSCEATLVTGRRERFCRLDGTWGAVDASTCHSYVGHGCANGQTCAGNSHCNTTSQLCECPNTRSPMTDPNLGQQVCMPLHLEVGSSCATDTTSCAYGSYCDTTDHTCKCNLNTHIVASDLGIDFCSEKPACPGTELLVNGVCRTVQAANLWSGTLTSGCLAHITTKDEWEEFLMSRIELSQTTNAADDVWLSAYHASGLFYFKNSSQQFDSSDAAYSWIPWLGGGGPLTAAGDCVVTKKADGYAWRFVPCTDAYAGVCAPGSGGRMQCPNTGVWERTTENATHGVIVNVGCEQRECKRDSQGCWGLVIDTSCTRFVNETCLKDDACKGNSFCQPTEENHATKQCRCSQGWKENLRPSDSKYDCRDPEPHIGDSCLLGESCKGGSMCNGTHCICAHGKSAQFESDTNVWVCVPDSVYVTDSCRDGQSCQGDSICFGYSECRCPVGKRPTRDTSAPSGVERYVCVSADAYAGESCAAQQTCQGGSTCTAGRCECPPGQEPKMDACLNKNLCVTASSQPGETCANGEICLGHSNCVSGTCACAANENIFEGVCVGELAMVWDNCTAYNPCNSMTKSACVDGTCICPRPYYFNELSGFCSENITLKQDLTFSLYQEPCSTRKMCEPTEMTLCQKDKCSCHSSRAFREGMCMLPGECTNPDQKYDYTQHRCRWPVEGEECDYRCEPQYIMCKDKPGGKKCEWAHYQETCRDKCINATSMICNTRTTKCECKDGYYFDAALNDCTVKPGIPGELCSLEKTCINDGRCDRSKHPYYCICDPGYAPRVNDSSNVPWCLPKLVPLDGACPVGVEICLYNSVCNPTTKTCHCGEGSERQANNTCRRKICPAHGNYPETYVNAYATLPCDRSTDVGLRKRKCAAEDVWDEEDDMCIGTSTQQLEDYLRGEFQRHPTAEACEYVLKAINYRTADVKSSADAKELVELMSYTLERCPIPQMTGNLNTGTDEKLAKETLRVMDYMLNENIADHIQNNAQTATLYAFMVEKLSVAMSRDFLKSHNDRLAAGVPENQVDVRRIMEYDTVDGNRKIQTGNFVIRPGQKNSAGFTTNKGACMMSKLDTPDLLSRKDNFGMACTIMDLSLKRFVPPKPAPEGSTYELAPTIISVSVDAGDLSTQAKKDLMVTLKFMLPKRIPAENLQCGWLQHNPTTERARFQTSGCTLSVSDDKSALCTCTHTTNYALLMQLDPPVVEDEHRDILRWLTHFCLGISIICLLVAMCVLLYIRKMQTKRIVIMRNLCICLLLGQLFFLIGLHLSGSYTGCRMMTALASYFFLATFLWKFSLASNLIFLSHAQPHETQTTGIPLWINTLFCYIVPASAVFFEAIIDWEQFAVDDTPKDPGYCWFVGGSWLTYAFACPIFIIAVINLIFTVLAALQARDRLKQFTEGSIYVITVKATVKFLMVVCPLVGVTWMFGGLLWFDVNDDLTLVAAYIFIILCGVQGVVIMIMIIFKNREINEGLSQQEEQTSAGDDDNKQKQQYIY